MSFQFVNVSGSALQLTSMGQLLAVTPVGFNAQLPYTGEIAVATLGVMNIATNYSTNLTATGSVSAVTFYNSAGVVVRIDGIGGLNSGSSALFNIAHGVSVVFGNADGSHTGEVSVVIPTSDACTLIMGGDYDAWNGTFNPVIGTTNVVASYTTNSVGSVSLGSFTAGPDLRQVVVGASVATSDYSLEIALVTFAFLLAAGGFVGQRLWRVARSIAVNTPD